MARRLRLLSPRSGLEGAVRARRPDSPKSPEWTCACHRTGPQHDVSMSMRNSRRIDQSRLVSLRRRRHLTVMLGITVAVSVVLVLAAMTAWLLERDAPETRHSADSVYDRPPRGH